MSRCPYLLVHRRIMMSRCPFNRRIMMSRCPLNKEDDEQVALKINTEGLL